MELVVGLKAAIPPWIRLNRIFRALPVEDIVEGITQSNSRQVLAYEMKRRSLRCRLRAVVENEFGEVGIDEKILGGDDVKENVDEQIIEMMSERLHLLHGARRPGDHAQAALRQGGPVRRRLHRDHRARRPRARRADLPRRGRDPGAVLARRDRDRGT